MAHGVGIFLLPSFLDLLVSFSFSLFSSLLTSYQQVDVREGLLGLLKGLGMPKVKEIVYTITVDTDWTTHGGRVDGVAVLWCTAGAGARAGIGTGHLLCGALCGCRLRVTLALTFAGPGALFFATLCLVLGSVLALGLFWILVHILVHAVLADVTIVVPVITVSLVLVFIVVIATFLSSSSSGAVFG